MLSAIAATDVGKALLTELDSGGDSSELELLPARDNDCDE
jgi:hypothetical protein